MFPETMQTSQLSASHIPEACDTSSVSLDVETWLEVL